METRFWTVLKILNPYVRTTNQANLPEVETSKSLCWDDRLGHSAGTESQPAAQTPTNRACFPDDARSTMQTPSKKMQILNP